MRRATWARPLSFRESTPVSWTARRPGVVVTARVTGASTGEAGGAGAEVGPAAAVPGQNIEITLPSHSQRPILLLPSSLPFFIRLRPVNGSPPGLRGGR